tara:strand:+ start:110 stop:742 length:633 start_codon:yes stop_codon:yes gene_type:complete
MKTPMHSIRNKASSKKVSKDMIKVGISSNFNERKKQYENTYRSKTNKKSHVIFAKTFETNKTYRQCKDIENKVKKNFKKENLFGEYYEKHAYKEILIFLTNILENKQPVKILKNEIFRKKDMIKSKRKRNKFYECKFFRTHNEIHARCVPHNVKRWKWIDNNGKGRTYNEINKADSVYRQCIKRKSYLGNTSSIDIDLRYDISKRMIEIR